MNRFLTIALLLGVNIISHAQMLTVSSFRMDPDDFSAASYSSGRRDPSGEMCSLVKISTRLTGFSFDAGEQCIADVVYASPGIWLYIPSSTRYITISHRVSGTLFRWNFPVPLEAGRTYQMTLKSEMPRIEKTPKPRTEKTSFNIDGFSSHFIQGQIGIPLNSGNVDGIVLGLNYCFMPGRWGFFTSVDWSSSSGFAFFAGPSMRLLESPSSTDWQIYAGPGITPGGLLGADVGTRIGWNTGKVLSRYDFSVGCQYWGNDTFVPYIGLGSKITAYSAAAAVALILCLGLGAL